ncbi:DUF1697 domain-containing protein [Dyadobacter sp. CY345]|uniref:DUF1697 domain-containing protein n=1 Tax=Dyadobacter sp. CY345 TaxID=2909335 RepID=UPI001F28989E|nr:DUF1697 domain-containing protein [Dyadobacter sp. CY345]MCF2443150.1 DUF1697 domain-containing protein [Dyadobacter sp. CY345]
MKTYVAILRGINVSGQKLIKMAELKMMFESLNFGEVKTYIQSGNIAFMPKPGNDKDLQFQIHEAILKTFHFDVPVIVLDETETKDIQENNPFLTNRNEDESKLHVTFLSEKPQSDLFEKLTETAQFLPDEWILAGRAIYIFCPEGYGKTKLNNNFFEKKLKVTATTRNWKTINELVAMVS